MKVTRASDAHATRSINLRPWLIVGIVLIELCVLMPLALRLRPDRHVEDLLNTPTIVEQFGQGRLQVSTVGSDQSRLIDLAEGLARLINPAVPVATAATGQDRRPGSGANQAQQSRNPIKLVATAYYPNQPARSMALVVQMGLEPMWVKSGYRVGHLVIDQIRSGLVICKDGTRTIELRIQGHTPGMALAIQDKYIVTDDNNDVQD